MPFRVRISILVSLISLLFVSGARAQTAPAPIKISETVVVTATGKEEPVSQVGASITVLTREQIEQRHALSMIDLLRTVPGVAAARNGGVGNLTSLWVRGGESTYNKVLLDGMPLNEPGGVFNFATLSPENIDRIEVLRGAHSALFGSDAMASVIQIFTIHPAGSRPQANVTLDAGNYNTKHLAANGGAIRGPLEYSATVSRLMTNNREPNNVNRTTTLSGTLAGRPKSGGLVRVIGRGEFGRTGTPGPTAFGRPDMDAFFDHKDGDFLAGWNQPLGTRVLQQAAYSFTKTRYKSRNLVVDPPYTASFGSLTAPFQSSDFLSDLDTNVKRHHVDYRADATLGPNQTLTAAFAYDGERAVLADLRSTAAPQTPTRNNTGTTVQYESLAGPVSLVGGVRFEHNGSFGDYVAPRAAVSWLIQSGNPAVGSTRLKGSGGRGIKEPTLRQSYSPSPFDLGNPDLKPERSRGFDAGVEQRFAHDRLRAEATFFSNHFDDLIGTGPSDPVTFGSQYVNIGDTQAHGWELSMDAAAQPGLAVHGSYVWQSSKVINSNNSFSAVYAKGRELLRRPRHSGSIQAEFSRSRVSVGIGMLYVGKRVDSDFRSLDIESNDSYTTINANGDIRIARRTSGFVNIENLGNFQYMDPLGYRGLGRTIRVGLRTTF